MKTIIQVLGPTGVGKSSISVRLAQLFRGEIISADSMQVYKGFDIGTDKITPGTRGGIPHHLIDILEDCSQFNASIFLEKSFATAEAIVHRDHLPIVCGGTALYLKTMRTGIFPEKEEKRVCRASLERIAQRWGLQKLWDKLYSVDPAYAAKVGKNDKVRIIRAMEIYYNNGEPPSQIFSKTQTPFKDYRFIRIGLNMEREKLYRRIEQRVDYMMERGLQEEVKHLAETRDPACPPFKSLGYKEILMFFNNPDMSLDEAVTLIKQHSRNFAKRQLSWFRQEKDITWFDPGNFTAVRDFLGEQLNRCQS